MEQTTRELDGYYEFTENRSAEVNGLITNLYRLPSGIKQIAIMFYSQMAPFPSYGTLLQAETFPQIWMSISVIVYELFWFFIFYTLFVSLCTKRSYKYFSQGELTLLIIAFIFIIANTAHTDIRRMMAAYPVIYLLYLKLRNGHISKYWFASTTRKLAFLYIILTVTYSVLKFA
jgi:hypothetical protein